MKDISYFALIAACLFVVIPIWVSYRQNLGISKEIAFSSIRALIQMILIGYLITFIFSVETGEMLIFIILIMVLIAGKTCARRGARFSNAFIVSVVAILGSEAASVLLWLTFDIVDFKARYIIPMSGIIIGGAMTVASLTFDRMLSEFESTKDLIMAKLALGASPRQSCQELIEKTIKAALIPNIEVMKTIGLIHLPGMMTGAIIAGASPIVAVKYQLVILFSNMASACITAIFTCFLSYPTFFKQKMF